MELGHVLSESSAVGDIVHSFFGYVAQPNPLEIITWAVYVTLVVTAFLGLWSRRRRQTVPAAPGRA